MSSTFNVFLLKPNPLNTKIYGYEPVDLDLIKSIKEIGLKESLVIKPDGTLISGHRRWKALQALGYTEVPCVVRTYNSELEERKDFLAYNKQREKTYSQRMAEAEEHEVIIAEENRLKQIEAGKQNIIDYNNSQLVHLNWDEQAILLDNFKDADFNEKKQSAIRNQTDFRTSELIGLSRSTFNRLKPVYEATKIGNSIAIKLIDKVDNAEMSIFGAERIFKASPKLAEKAIEKLEENPKISPEKAIQEAKVELKKEQIKTQGPSKLPNGLYDVILADPPWRYDFSLDKNDEVENHYPTMELEEIKSLKIPSSDNCILFLWAIAPKLEEAFEVLCAWNFSYKTCAVWDKMWIGMGFWFRGQHELLLLATRGNPSLPLYENRFPSVIREKRERHSEKPECVYDMIERMCPNGKYLEMFARTKRTGWTAWGNQCIKEDLSLFKLGLAER